MKSPGLAAVISLFIIGGGQIYNGQIGKGLGMLGLAMLAYVAAYAGIMLMFFVGIFGALLTLLGVLGVLCLWVYGIFNAYRTAEDINKRSQSPPGRNSPF